MKNLSRKKLAFYGLVLLAALTGLIIDRTSSASAAPASPSTGALLQADLVHPADADEGIIEPPLAAVFQNRRAGSDETEASTTQPEITPIRNAFSLSSKMKAHYASSGQENHEQQETHAAEQERMDRESVANFMAAHSLKGTFIRPPDIWAIVDNVILRIGDDLDGFVLREIDHYRVIFEMGDNRVVLELPDTLGSQGP